MGITIEPLVTCPIKSPEGATRFVDIKTCQTCDQKLDCKNLLEFLKEWS